MRSQPWPGLSGRPERAHKRLLLFRAQTNYPRCAFVFVFSSGGAVARSTLRRADRVSSILDRIAGQGSVDAGALASEFAVSVATIRRDLQALEDQKLLNRT